MRDLLTREEVLEKFGTHIVNFLDCLEAKMTHNINCGKEVVEFSASIEVAVTAWKNKDELYRDLAVFYYQDTAAVNECDDLSNLIWTPSGYTVK